jgi:HTH-type transcriptional regulator, transcriptional repressor of NAD biosynthesis genes
MIMPSCGTGARIHGSQIRLEEAALISPAANKFLYCDATPLTTHFDSLELFHRAAPELETLAQRHYHHHLLCADDLPFTQDGTRRDSVIRSKGQAWYLENLSHLRQATLDGSIQSRIAETRVVIGA